MDKCLIVVMFRSCIIPGLAEPLLTLDLPHVLSSPLQSSDSGSLFAPRTGVSKDISPVVDLKIPGLSSLDKVCNPQLFLATSSRSTNL
jgi:hypothetical protein